LDKIGLHAICDLCILPEAIVARHAQIGPAPLTGEKSRAISLACKGARPQQRDEVLAVPGGEKRTIITSRLYGLSGACGLGWIARGLAEVRAPQSSPSSGAHVALLWWTPADHSVRAHGSRIARKPLRQHDKRENANSPLSPLVLDW
jgi:hypothetical protein